MSTFYLFIYDEELRFSRAQTAQSPQHELQNGCSLFFAFHKNHAFHTCQIDI